MLGTVKAVDSAVVATTLVNFNFTNGGSPYGSLIIDSSGNLYGTTSSGGSGSGGTVFELSGTNHLTFNTLINFNTSSGSGPYSSLLLDSSGNLYGTTFAGPGNGSGSVFELSGTNHQTLNTLTSFNGISAGLPLSNLIMDSAGNLYGTTSNPGAGTAFELSGTSHQTFNVLATFNNSTGPRCYAGLIADSAGNFYGTTNGSVFELTGSNHETLIPLASFGSETGLTIDAAGNLYGVTAGTGANGTDTIFELSGTGHQTVTTLADLSSGYISEKPNGALLADAAGNLFGTTVNGGVSGDGSVYELSGPNHQTLTMLISFTSANEFPFAGLAADPSGNLYGTTYAGSSINGTAYEVTGTGFFTGKVITGQSYHFIASTSGGIGIVTVAGLNLQSGGSVILDPASNHSSRQLLVITGSGLSLPGSIGSWKAMIDVGNNDIDLPGSSLAMVTDQVHQGFASGTWNGAGGIKSSSAAGDTRHLTAIGVIQNNQSGSSLYSSTRPFDGYSPGAADILIKYTCYGDANLDGKVDASDYSLIDNGFLKHLTGWFNGDFNYDAVINGSDYTLIDNAFNRQGATLAATIAEPTAQVLLNPIETVPEPSGVMLLLLGVALLSNRVQHNRVMEH